MADEPDRPRYGGARSERQVQVRRAALRELLRQSYEGQLTRERIERTTKAINWLVEKWGEDHPCPHCGNETWSVGEELVELPLAGLDEVYTMVVVGCDNCGNTVFINAGLAGLDPDEDE